MEVDSSKLESLSTDDNVLNEINDRDEDNLNPILSEKSYDWEARSQDSLKKQDDSVKSYDWEARSQDSLKNQDETKDLDESSTSSIKSLHMKTYAKPWAQVKKPKTKVLVEKNVSSQSELILNGKQEVVGGRGVKPKKKPRRDFEQENMDRLKHKKHTDKNGFYKIFAEDDSDVISVTDIVYDYFSHFQESRTSIYDVEESIFASSPNENPEVTSVNQLLTNGITKLKSGPKMTLFSNSAKFVFQMDLSTYETRGNLYEKAMKVYKNAVSLFYAPKEIYEEYTQKIIITGKSVVPTSKDKNIKDILEKRNCKKTGNTVTMEMYMSDLGEEVSKEILDQELPVIDKQLDEERAEDFYTKAINDGSVEEVHINGITSIRVEVHKMFGFLEKKFSHYGFMRLGFSENDSLDVVRKRYDYLVKHDVYQGKSVILPDFETLDETFPGVKLSIGNIHQTHEMFIMTDITLSDDSEETEMKIKYIQQMTLLVMSKYLLEDFGFIGFTNTYQQVIFEPYLDVFENFSRPMIKFIKVFRNMLPSTNQIKNLDVIKNQCTEIQNKIITRDFVGERDEGKDLEGKDYTFLAFKVGKEYRFVFSSPRVTMLRDHDLFEMWGQVDSNKQRELKCSFHNDNYFTGINFKEMYFISFFVNENDLKNLKFTPKTAAEAAIVKKKNIEVVKNKNVFKKGMDIDALFAKKLLI